MNRSPLRLVQKRWKAVYIVGGWLVTLLFSRLMDLLPSEFVGAVLGSIAYVAWIYIGTRIFRGKEELLAPPRAWWRMTARPKAGFWLGALWVIESSYVAFQGVTRAEYVIISWPTAIRFGILAYLYFASSIRLRRANSVATRPTVA